MPIKLSNNQVVLGRVVYIERIVPVGTALTTGDAKGAIHIPEELNGMQLISADFAVDAASSSGAVTIAMRNLTDTTELLSTNGTVEQGEYSTYTATTPPVVDVNYEIVSTGDRLSVDVDGAGTGVTGLVAILTFDLA